MATIPPKKVTLRAFKINNPNLTEVNSGIIRLLQQVLTSSSIAADRRMPLNADDPDRELLANFSWARNNAYLFGMMLRVIPADNGGIIGEDMFNQPIITMAQVTAGRPDQSQYKGHFYFALNNDYLVTNLSGTTNIDRLQTYINWLLESVRGDRLFQFTELTKLPEGVKLSQIKDIQFVGGGNVVNANAVEETSNSWSVALKNVTEDILKSVINDTESLDAIRANRLIEARLFLKVKGKPKDMAKNEFQRVMGAIATNVTNDNGLVMRTKDGNNYTGAEIKVKKTVSIECTEANRIVEEQLKQEMELFLSEIRNQ